MQFETASCSRFVVPELNSSDSSPAVSAGFVFPRAFGIDFFRSVTSRMTRKAEVSDSRQCKVRRYYESPSRQLKNEGEKIFSALCAERSVLLISIHCLRQWPYHSKIPRAGAGMQKHVHSKATYPLRVHQFTTQQVGKGSNRRNKYSLITQNQS